MIPFRRRKPTATELGEAIIAATPVPFHPELSDDELLAKLESSGCPHAVAVLLVAHRDDPLDDEFMEGVVD